jgi:hypothetical protein
VCLPVVGHDAVVGNNVVVGNIVVVEISFVVVGIISWVSSFAEYGGRGFGP